MIEDAFEKKNSNIVTVFRVIDIDFISLGTFDKNTVFLIF